MAEQTVLESVAGGVLTMTLNRPDVLNAMNGPMIESLLAGMHGAADDPDICAVVLTGAGRAFSAGLDLKYLATVTVENGDVGGALNDVGVALLQLMADMNKPVIAKINGHCYTGALELALGADLIYVAEEAKLGDTHAKWGLRPSWGMSQRLPRRVGLQKARELSYTARVFDGRQAADWGLAVAAVPLSALDNYVDGVLDAIRENSSGTIAAYKDLYNQVPETTLSDGLRYELDTGYEINDTAERLAGFRGS